jgi:hypothetical protein
VRIDVVSLPVCQCCLSISAECKINSHNKALEQCFDNVLLSDIGRKSANIDNSTARLSELWVVEE